MPFGARFIEYPDLFPTRLSGETWGSVDVSIELLGGPYVYAGLDESQASTLAQRFGDLCRPVIAPTSSAARTSVFRVSPGDFTTFDVRDWEYVMDVDYEERGVRMAGLQVMARIDLGEHLTSGLWTSTEDPRSFHRTVEVHLRLLVAYALLRRGGLLLHSSGLRDGDLALLFVGPSGAGKSTLAAMSMQEGRPILSDDLNAVLPHAEGYVAERFPFAGIHAEFLRDASRSRLAGVFALRKGSESRVRGLSRAEAAAALTGASVCVNRDPHRYDVLVAAIERLLDAVPARELTFCLGGAVWDTLDRASTA